MCNIEAARLYQRQYYQKHKARVNATAKAWRSKPENRQKQCEYTQKSYKKHRQKRLLARHRYGLAHKEEELTYGRKYNMLRPEKSRRHHLMRAYGITPEDYETLLREQGGKCPICSITNDEHRKRFEKPLFVDHNHKTKKVRGLLCDKCNNGLGRFQDSIPYLERAIEYLKRGI